MNYQDVVGKLQGRGRFSIPSLRKMAKEIGNNHELAIRLWQDDRRETRILASMIADPQQVTEALMEEWVIVFDSWEICDQVCSNLFAHTPFVYRKCFEWSKADGELVKRAGFVLMARLAATDQNATDAKFALFMPLITEAAIDSRSYVKKSVSWALRQIGKRNYRLNKLALETANELKERSSTNARWIASDAIQKLTSEKIQSKVQPSSFRVIISPTGEVQDIKMA